MHGRYENAFSCLNRPKLSKFRTVKSYVFCIYFDMGYIQSIKEDDFFNEIRLQENNFFILFSSGKSNISKNISNLIC